MNQPHVMLAIMPNGRYAKMACKDKRYQSYGELESGWTLPALLHDYQKCCAASRLPPPRVTVVALLAGGSASNAAA